MWWHGGARLIERSERESLSAVATYDVFGEFVSLITIIGYLCMNR
jgi:hypothetical protein